MSHSHQVREYQITDSGINLVDVYVGPEGVLTGTARVTQEARERAAAKRRQQAVDRRRREIGRRREAIERQIAELRASIEIEEEEAGRLVAEEGAHEAILTSDRAALAVKRGAAE
jgi:circadian clock protein KaiC